MPALVVRCRTCRREHTPAYEDYVDGTWRTCPSCRDAGLTDERTPRVIVIDEPHPPAVTGTCQHTMMGKTRRHQTKAGTMHRAGWRQRCPRKATVIHRGRRYCQMHAPAAASRDTKGDC